MNNFHYIATPNRVFCSQTHGNDSNDGLTPDTPKKTLAGIRAIVTSVRNDVIISGHFKDEVYGNPTGSPIHSITGDGICIIEYANNQSNNAVFTAEGTQINITFKNIKFQNIKYLFNASNYWSHAFSNCIFENVSAYKTYLCQLDKCTIYNCYFTPYTSASGARFFDTKVFNSYLPINSSATGSISIRSYFNKATLLEITDVTNSKIGTFNNFECKFKYLTNYYDTLTALVTAYPVLNDTEGNRSDVITFNGTQYGDYSVPSNSPLLNASLWGNAICGNAFEGQAVYWSNGLTGWTISQTTGVDDLEISGSTLQLKAGHTIGSITKNSDSQIDIGALKTLKYFKWLGSLSFNNATGVNTPVSKNYTSSDAGYIPIRLTVEIKYSPISKSQSEWDAIPWICIDLGDEMKFDGINGNGDPGYDFTLPSILGGIKARYLLARLTFRTVL